MRSLAGSVSAVVLAVIALFAGAVAPASAVQSSQTYLACTALRAVNREFERLIGDDTLCPQNFDPVSAHADGLWKGFPVRFAKIYSNRCVEVSRPRACSGSEETIRVTPLAPSDRGDGASGSTPDAE